MSAAPHAHVADAAAAPAWARVLITAYGQLAFGVAVLLVLWSTIIGPELHAARAASVNIAEAFRAGAADMSKAAESTRGALEVLARTVTAARPGGGAS